MTTRTRIKLALVLSGLLVFGAGIRTDSVQLRWAGIALVFVAFVMRFMKPPAASE